MPLFQKINDDMKAAMKSGDKPRLEVIRFALAGLHAAQKEKELKTPGAVLSDEEVITVLQKDAKRRKESIELFKQGKRDDLVTKEEADLAVLSEYIPKELTRAEIEKIRRQKRKRSRRAKARMLADKSQHSAKKAARRGVGAD